MSTELVGSLPFRRWMARPSFKVFLVLLLALVTINAAAVWVIVTSRKSAEAVAEKDLQLRVTANARSIEGILSSRRGDLIFLSQSSPLVNAPVSLSAPDPIARRRSRLDIESTLLLFMASHQELDRLVIRDGTGSPLVAVGRRESTPVLLDAKEYPDPEDPREGLLTGCWPVRGTAGSLETIINVERLLSTAAPGIDPQFTLIQRKQVDLDSQRDGVGDAFVAAAPVRDERWPVPVAWTLVGQGDRLQLVGSIAALANRYRLTVILNLVVMTVALVLGAIGFQQLRRSVALEAVNRQHARVRDLERQVMHSDRLAGVGRLAAGFAHEINNPLEGMANYLSLLEEDLRSGNSESALDLTERVREGHERIAAIIRQVLVFSDPGSAPQSFVDLNETLEDTVRFVRSNPMFRKTDVILRKSGDDLNILGNRVTLGQLFLNLLLNASQVQPDGGQIEVASLRDGSRAVVLVADCGPGIPTDVLPRIFEPFYSTRGSTGLGLSVCHGIVNEHRGEIRAENRAEGGAIFQVSFPLERDESEA